jgi:tetratricopeptide (TPR) repeat protein
MDQPDPEVTDSTPSTPERPSARRRPVRALGDIPQLDRWLTIGLWVVGASLVLVGSLFAWSVYSHQQTVRLTSPALQVIDAVQKLVDESPSDPLLRSRLAEALATAGRFDEAKQQLYAALKLDDKYVGAYQNLATIELAQKDYANATVHWNKVLELTVDSEMQGINERREIAYFSLGQIALIQKDYVGAIGYFNAALRIRKTASDTYLLLAKSYQGLDQLDRAMEQVNIALTFDPKYPEAHYFRGKLLLAQGNTVEAAYDFRAALDGAPDNPEAQAAIDSLGSYESWFGKASTAWAAHETSAAFDAVEIARSIEPGSYDAAVLNGTMLESAGDFKDAAAAYTVALKARPEDPAATAALKRAEAASKE